MNKDRQLYQSSCTRVKINEKKMFTATKKKNTVPDECYMKKKKYIKG